MRKKIFLIIFFITLATIVSFSLYNLFVNFFDIGMQNLPKGELIKEVTSQNGKYSIKAYLCNGGGTVDYAVRCEVNFLGSNKKPRNIYWDYHKDYADIEWIDNVKVRINGYVLNVLIDKYDFREH